LNESDTNLQRGTTTTGQWKNEAHKIESSGEWNQNETVKGPHETRMKLRNFKWRQSHRETNGKEIVFGGAEVGDAVNEIYCVLTHFQLYLNEGHYNFWEYRRSVGGAGRSARD